METKKISMEQYMKKELISRMTEMLWVAEVDVRDLRLSEDGNTVTIRFNSGWEKVVNIECDSRLAIINDVLKALK